MTVLPLTTEQTTEYNNVPTTPSTAPLGDIINELTGAIGPTLVVDNQAERLAIPASARYAGLQALQLDHGGFYRLEANLTTWDLVQNQNIDPAFFPTTFAFFTLYVSTTGNNANTGRSLGQAFATIQRALDEIPHGYTAAVLIRVGVGTFSQTSLTFNAIPGQIDPGLSVNGLTLIVGNIVGNVVQSGIDLSSGLVLAAGKAAQYTKSVGLVVSPTDGSHFVANEDFGYPFGPVAVLASTAPTIRVAAASSSSAGGFSPFSLCSYATGTIIEVDNLLQAGVANFNDRWGANCFITCCTVKKFSSLLLIFGRFLMQAVKIDFGGILGSISGVNSWEACSAVSSSPVLVSSDPRGIDRFFSLNTLFSNIEYKQGSGIFNSLSGSVFRGTQARGVTLGTVGQAVSSTLETTHAVDFENSGDAFSVNGYSAVNQQAGLGAITCAITGRLFTATRYAQYLRAGGTVTGTVMLSSVLSEGGALVGFTGLTALVNSAAAGSDLIVGANAVTSWAGLGTGKNDYAAGDTSHGCRAKP